MQRDPLDADNSQKYFKNSHLMEWYSELITIYKPYISTSVLHYNDVKKLINSMPPLLDNILDDSIRFKLINKKINTAFQHCFIDSIEDAQCVASMMIMIENLFINMICMRANSLYVLNKDSIEVYLKNTCMIRLNIDFARRISVESKLLFAIIRCTPTIDELDFELNKAMQKLITFCMKSLNEWTDKFVKNKEFIDTTTKYTLIY